MSWRSAVRRSTAGSTPEHWTGTSRRSATGPGLRCPPSGPVQGDRAGTAGSVPGACGCSHAGRDPCGGLPRRLHAAQGVRPAGSAPASGGAGGPVRDGAGRAGQVDFAHFRFPWGRRYLLLVVLGYSRLLWLRFYRRQDMATLLEGLEAAFGFFGGVLRELLFDQMKSVIVRDLRGEGGRVTEKAEFLRFAAHWGFRVRGCRPYHSLALPAGREPERVAGSPHRARRPLAKELNGVQITCLRPVHRLP